MHVISFDDRSLEAVEQEADQLSGKMRHITIDVPEEFWEDVVEVYCEKYDWEANKTREDGSKITRDAYPEYCLVEKIFIPDIRAHVNSKAPRGKKAEVMAHFDSVLAKAKAIVAEHGTPPEGA